MRLSPFNSHGRSYRAVQWMAASPYRGDRRSTGQRAIHASACGRRLRCPVTFRKDPTLWSGSRVGFGQNRLVRGPDQGIAPENEVTPVVAGGRSKGALPNRWVYKSGGPSVAPVGHQTGRREPRVLRAPRRTSPQSTIERCRSVPCVAAVGGCPWSNPTTSKR